MPEKSFMLIAGEASGDTLGAELVKALRAEPGGEHFQLFGAGGPKMSAAGVELAFDLSAHAVVGIWEVLKNYGKFRGFFYRLLELARERRPDCIILIDYPGFNLRFAKALRKANCKAKIVYYVSPQIWAWHESRVHQITRDIDLMLSIFPFEKKWYAQRKPDFKVEFVGHPLVDRFEQTRAAEPSQPRILLLPGSRIRELKKHLPVMLPAARRLASETGADVEIVVPSENLKKLALALGATDVPIQIGGLADALRRATIAIASSGTVTMECAYFGVPTVVLYKTSASTYWLGRRFIRVKYLAMPNLLANRAIYPEFIQEDASEENIYRAAADLLKHPERRQIIRAELRNVIASLGEPGASTRAAKAILAMPGLHSF
jgi:lipid-A-disaccharide synthase